MDGGRYYRVGKRRKAASRTKHALLGVLVAIFAAFLITTGVLVAVHLSSDQKVAVPSLPACNITCPVSADACETWEGFLFSNGCSCKKSRAPTPECELVAR